MSHNQPPLIAIEGNIGSGKTTLATTMAQLCNAHLLLENFEDNPFLELFYQNPAKYALSTELSFLALRYKQWAGLSAHLFTSTIIADHSFFRSWIFAQVTLPEREFRLFERLFEVLRKEVPLPKVIVYLRASTERMLTQIKKRARPAEQHITEEYLHRLNTAYQQFIRQIRTTIPVLEIHIGNAPLHSTQIASEILNKAIHLSHSSTIHTIALDHLPAK